MAKLHCTELQNKVRLPRAAIHTSRLQVADQCLQLHGGYGYMWSAVAQSVLR